MGRPKCYTSPAARQAAYRQRLTAEMVLVNRHSLTQLEDRVTRLLDAIKGPPIRGMSWPGSSTRDMWIRPSTI